MKKYYNYALALVATLASLSAVAQDKPQIGNGDFESWANYSDANKAPDNWNSFQTAEGQLASMVNAVQVGKSNEVRPGSTGSSSAVIWCRAVKVIIMSVPAQGNLTLGCINAGSTTAASKGNYNFSKIEDEKKSEAFTGKPDSIVAWVKYVPKKELKDYPYARMTAIIHDNNKYITYSQESDDTDENKSHVVAKAESNFESKGGKWQRLSVPFTYTENEDAQYIIINFSTNATPGKGTEGDSLYIDDIEMIYNEPEAPAPVITFVVDGETVETVTYAGEQIIAPEQKEREGYTFAWDQEVPAEPTEDMTITGTWTVNKYTVTYKLDDETVHTEEVEYGAAIPAYVYTTEDESISISEWEGEKYETMPAQDIEYNQSMIAISIKGISNETSAEVFSINGTRSNAVKSGVNIVRKANGSVVKILVK